MNEETLTKIVEFVAENPSIFKDLGRFFKRKGKEKVESSKRRLVTSLKIPSEEESDDHYPKRSYSKRTPSKFTSKLASLFRALSQDLLGRRTNDSPKRLVKFFTDYTKAPPFTDDINDDLVPSNFKLRAL